MDKLMVLVAAVHSRILELGDRDQERGATATEYALLVALIAIAIVGAVTIFGNQLGSFFSAIGSKVGVWVSQV